MCVDANGRNPAHNSHSQPQSPPTHPTPHTESAGGNLAAALLVAVGSALQLREAHALAIASGGCCAGGGKKTKKGGPYPSPAHHPGLASLEANPSAIFRGLSCQSLASCVGEGGDGEEEEALRRASSVLAAVGEGGVGLLLLPEQEEEQVEAEAEAERPGTPPTMERGDTKEEGTAVEAEAPSTPVKGAQQAGGEGTGSGTSSEASSPTSESAAEAAGGEEADDEEEEGEEDWALLRMPDAVVLFYPVLNFCLSPSPSRVSRLGVVLVAVYHHHHHYPFCVFLYTHGPPLIDDQPIHPTQPSIKTVGAHGGPHPAPRHVQHRGQRLPPHARHGPHAGK